MAGRQRTRRGGILGLRVDILERPERRAALQYDLLTHGLSLEYLGSEALTWYDLIVFVRLVQGETHSALAKALHGTIWSIEAQLLATIADSTAVGNWQRAGRKHAPKPKRIPRPWEKVKATVLGSKPIPISAFNDWWDDAKPKRRRRTKKPPTTL